MNSVNSDVFSCPSKYDSGVVIVQRAADFLDLRDIKRCELVCKLFNAALNKPEIWIGLSLREGILRVEGKDRDRKADIQVLDPIISGKARIRRFLGEPVGVEPYILEKVFNLLNDPDLFEPNLFEEKKLMKKTFVFVVDYPAVKRTTGEETPLDLDKEGNLIELPVNQVVDGKELTIPLSLKNLRVLCKHPLDGKQNMPVFAEYSSNGVFEQCGASSNKVSVYFMRRCIADETRSMAYSQQENFVNERGFEVTPIRIRALFDALEILEFGTCPDSREPRYTYARCPDIVRFGQDVYHAGIGDFAPRSGARVSNFGDDGSDYVGVAPGVPAEEHPPLELGSSLALDKGH